ncbi:MULTISPECIES: 1-phosphofructokinase family hexose kinase [Mycolicibacterium]|uniref:6-phosphofructokinase n=3 Tax=Mycolicibacterium gilvum TaxID=1804 RepID=E6TE52_MYCSR|nr:MULTISPECIES: 1-phosphofructokinase family hexose kinase [Mycolicibacterium]ABP47453.1 6-phosphofructokinase [Mycolicibacterium gilvum PYR-GCK]ADU00961.1 6-phosphofructokinase [Mycolicibacterium gilvum Spyr1]MBV5242514.1 1-phosphofructokinase family hexose kinase [Mycolicibacterium sp. PAM1]MCV7058614.1 1-phosphofructokinase family hexose kinase [Mycolicibacterium gilvum]STZ42018.1 ribokinase-like domain-containing protein [Mycolicibacterium gilvum]
MSGTAAIVTLTMNTALDVTADADNVVPTEKIRCRAERYDAGGGGVNVARFAHALGAPVSAVFTAGGSTGARVIDLVHATGVCEIPVLIEGGTRESFTVNDRASGRQYRFVLPGPVLSLGEQARCLEALRRAAGTAGIVVASGSLPPGVPPDFYQRVADICSDVGAMLVLDTSGGGLRHVTSGVHLLKPSIRELRECLDRPLHTEPEQIAAARELIDRGAAKVVVVSLGADGALLVTPDDSERLSAVPMTSVSCVGAGDALVAGVAVGLARRWPLGRAVRFGIAAASAKLQTPGTAAFHRDDVERYFVTQAAHSEA